MCFVGSPLLTSIEDLDYFGLNLSDFAAHDAAKDALFLGHAKDARLHGHGEHDIPETSTMHSSLSSSSSDVTLASDSSCVSMQSSPRSLRQGIPVSPRSPRFNTAPPSSPHHSESTTPGRRPSSSSSGCPFSGASASSTSVSLDRSTPQQNSPPLTTASEPMPLRSPVSSPSLLNKLFGSKQRSSYSPKSGKLLDKTNGTTMGSLGDGKVVQSAPMPIPRNACNGGHNSSGGSKDEDLGSGHKSSWSCSDSDELLVTYDQARVKQLPSSTEAFKLLNHSKQRASGAYQGEHPPSDEETTFAPVPHTLSADPLSLQGRGRLENAFQEVRISPHAHAGQLRSRNRMRVGTISCCSTTRDETSSWRWSCST
jgi:hypothetical protein